MAPSAGQVSGTMQGEGSHCPGSGTAGATVKAPVGHHEDNTEGGAQRSRTTVKEIVSIGNQQGYLRRQRGLSTREDEVQIQQQRCSKFPRRSHLVKSTSHKPTATRPQHLSCQPQDSSHFKPYQHPKMIGPTSAGDCQLPERVCPEQTFNTSKSTECPNAGYYSQDVNMMTSLEFPLDRKEALDVGGPPKPKKRKYTRKTQHPENFDVSRPVRRCPSCPNVLKPKLCALSCNNSRNKSRENSISDCEPFISPLPSPILLPALGGRNVGDLGDQLDHNLSTVASHSLLNTGITQDCRHNVYRHSSPERSIYLESSTEEQRKSGDNYDLDVYWPSTPADEKSDYSPVFVDCNSDFLPRSTETQAASDSQEGKPQFRVTQRSPGRAVMESDSRYAFASSATVCPREAEDQSQLDYLNQWLRSRTEDSTNNYLGIFATPNLFEQNRAWAGIQSANEIGVPRFSTSELSKDAVYSDYRSCIFCHIARRKAEKQVQFQPQQHYMSSIRRRDQTPQKLFSRGNPHAAAAQNPGQDQNAKTEKRYPRTLFSLPPSELPYPPLSPFHHPALTHYGKATPEGVSQGSNDASGHMSPRTLQEDHPYCLADFPKTFIPGHASSSAAQPFDLNVFQRNFLIAKGLPASTPLTAPEKSAFPEQDGASRRPFSLPVGNGGSNLTIKCMKGHPGKVPELFPDNSGDTRQIEATVACPLRSDQ